ncbi:hypothetical protein ACWDT5_24450 [Rhodococcus aetherivorans]|uniref:Uncharacterized protein n=1 Tax=Rhodococcus aetherivorans TaxID=191292 RepID=A0AA46SDJ5_9NOCA|nr:MULTISPECIES: hypothetical protein [Rhodococcus]OOL30703.1 hypothetical protein GQ85_18300 [Rhodococcus rhodochrous]KDE10519.1 hypothetical protein N505_0126610 [Rhodococcus aetherivorans]PND51266.1 hypothetical protein CQZ88_15310 [Rhodococcus sp. ENV425]UGQ41024.1 hypothetical protein LRQ66_23315 [Rhodococcus aetherivorans]USC15697.1 hypothetical protein KZJ41_01715 [Rhodococcus sp. 11-3]
MSGFPAEIVPPGRADGPGSGSPAAATCAAACQDYLAALDELLLGIGDREAGDCAGDVAPSVARRIEAVVRMKAVFESIASPEAHVSLFRRT